MSRNTNPLHVMGLSFDTEHDALDYCATMYLTACGSEDLDEDFRDVDHALAEMKRDDWSWPEWSDEEDQRDALQRVIDRH